MIVQYCSPCLTCTRVRDPQKCENKTCRDWQAWFIHRWEAMREGVRRHMAQSELPPIGVSLGGHQYASPHRVRDYLATDPCTTCPLGYCDNPCPVRRAWAEQKGEFV